jgi:GDP-L-fucose synthase
MTTTSDGAVLGHDARIYVAGHRGLVGSALTRQLQHRGYGKLILRTHAELDLTDQKQTEHFFDAERPEVVFLAAAKVGGIVANSTYPAEFIHQNLSIQTNVIHAAWRFGAKRLLFLGSSCIYPRMAPQPIKEDCLLSGPLEPTNRAYAVAKIAGIEMCWSYNRQYGSRFLAVMPSNLYGAGDNYHPENSHVIPALLRRFHEARTRGDSAVTVWGSGTPRREFLYSDDMADACVHLMELPADQYDGLLGNDESVTGRFEPPLVNIGVGEDVTIHDLAMLVAKVVGYRGDIVFDLSRPDGTPRKLLDVGLISRTGWKARTSLAEGLRQAYSNYLQAVGSGHGC